MNTDTHSYREKGRAVFLAAIMVLSMVAGVAVFAAPAAAQVNNLDNASNLSAVHYDSAEGSVGSAIEISASEGQVPDLDSGNFNINATFEDAPGEEFDITGEIGGDITVATDDPGRLLLNVGGNLGVSSNTTVLNGDFFPFIDQLLINDTTTSDGPVALDVSVSPTSYAVGDGASDDTGINFVGGPVVIETINTTSNSPNLDETFEITQGDLGVFRGTEANSSTRVVDTGALGLSTGDANFTDGEGTGVTTTVNFNNLGLDLTVDTPSDPIPGDTVEASISTNAAGGEVQFRLLDSDGNIVETTNTNIDGGGAASASFSPGSQGDFSVKVIKVGELISAESNQFTVGPDPDVQVSLDQRTTEVPTGDVGQLSFNLQGTDTANVTLDRSGYTANFTIVDGDADGQVTVDVNTRFMHTTASNNPAPFSAVTDPDTDGTDAVQFNGNQGIDTTRSEPLPQTQLSVDVVDDGDNDRDRGQLVLTERSTDSLSTHIAPANTLGDIADESDFSDLTSAEIQTFIDELQTPSETVAQGDDLVFLVQANGIFGNESNFDGEDGVTFQLEQRDPGLSDPETADAGESYVDVVTDADNERFIVVVDTDASDFTDVGAWDASFTVDGGSNPYVADDTTEEVTSQVDVVQEDSSFSLVDGEPYTIVSEEGAQVFGSTNLAPGTEGVVNAIGENFFRTADVEVDSEGNFVAEFDFSGVDTDQEVTLETAQGISTTPVAAEFGDTPEDQQSSSTEELEQQVADLEQQLEDRNTTIDELNNEIDSLTEELANAEDEQAALEDQLSTVEDERAELQNELANAEATIGDLESQVSDLESTNSDLESQVSDLESQVSELEGLEGADEDLQTVLDELGVDSVDAAVDEIQTLSESGDSDGSGPGFGIAAALVALIAAALLAVRRRD